MHEVKYATPDHPVLDIIARRWSPYGFSERLVAQADLQSIFEAARWAASSYNEQPWSYIVATRDDPGEFERLLSCLVEGNQAWARNVPVLALGVAKRFFALNNQPNRVCHHDLGLAAGNLCAEATARGLCVHQMAGILPDRARELYQIPDGYEAFTGIAIGYPADPDQLDPETRQRDTTPRTRRKLREFVFSGLWGNPSDLVT